MSGAARQWRGLADCTVRYGRAVADTHWGSGAVRDAGLSLGGHLTFADKWEPMFAVLGHHGKLLKHLGRAMLAAADHDHHLAQLIAMLAVQEAGRVLAKLDGPAPEPVDGGAA
jgi:hypothetical protein